MENKLLNCDVTLWARQTLESEIFCKKPASWFRILFYIVKKVNHTDTKQFKRGQGFFKYNWIAKSCIVSKAQIDHCIRWLKEAKQITTQKTTPELIITVINYNKYQNLQNYK